MGRSVDVIRRLALLGELRRAGKLIHGDADAYDDLIVQLEEVYEALDEAENDWGAPLPEEEY